MRSHGSDPKLLIEAVKGSGVKGTRLDIPVAVRGDRPRPAHRQVLRLGEDQLLTHDKGSNISWEDYAIAAVDELEKPAHIRQRFTVGY